MKLISLLSLNKYYIIIYKKNTNNDFGENGSNNNNNSDNNNAKILRIDDKQDMLVNYGTQTL